MATISGIPSPISPGVCVEEIPRLPPSIAQVETAIPAFIGYTEIAVDDGEQSLLNMPTRITSLHEYERYFGKADIERNLVVKIDENTFKVSASVGVGGRSKFQMHYALLMYFINGGGPCWIVSIADYTSSGGIIRLPELVEGLKATERENEITLYVFPDAQGLPQAVDYYELYKIAMKTCVRLQDRFTITDVWQDPDRGPEDWLTNIETLRSNIGSEVEFLKYAACYYPNLETTLDLYYGGEGIGDAHVAVDFPAGNSDNLDSLKTENNALYFQARSALRAIPCNMPPSPAMAGIYARIDATRGVWKAPANVSVDAVIEPSLLLTNENQSVLNVDAIGGKSINVIRLFTGRGILVWGARTLAGNDNEWRYVPVRRFFNMVEESTSNASAQFVFEPNDRNTWALVRSVIENFLSLQWRAGALMGVTIDEAYYVRVGLGDTMTASDILEGKMIVEIGMAVVRPAEFIVFRFSLQMLEGS